jgi:hypothetical protein
LKDLSTEDSITLGNLFSIAFMEPNRWLYATLGRQAWAPHTTPKHGKYDYVVYMNTSFIH